jgi:transcription elongation factor/antiterminator RfaH
MDALSKVGPRDDAAASGQRWYAVASLPHRERGVELQLRAQGFAPYLPLILKTVRHARRLQSVKRPLFPGYLFVSMDIDRDRWRSINGTFGARGLVMVRERPSPVPDGLVESLQDRMDGEGLTRFSEDLSIGQSVRVLSGPFADLVGSLERLDANDRVRVLLQVMGATVPVSLNSKQLYPAA